MNLSCKNQNWMSWQRTVYKPNKKFYLNKWRIFGDQTKVFITQVRLNETNAAPVTVLAFCITVRPAMVLALIRITRYFKKRDAIIGRVCVCEVAHLHIICLMDSPLPHIWVPIPRTCLVRGCKRLLSFMEGPLIRADHSTPAPVP